MVLNIVVCLIMLSGMGLSNFPLAFMANDFPAARVATEEGDTEKKGVLPVGQCTGLIHNILMVSELITSIIEEANEMQKRLPDITQSRIHTHRA